MIRNSVVLLVLALCFEMQHAHAQYNCIKPEKPVVDDAAIKKQNDRDVVLSTAGGAVVGGILGDTIARNTDKVDRTQGQALGGLLGGVLGNRTGQTVADRRSHFVYTEADLRYRTELTRYFACTANSELNEARTTLYSLQSELRVEREKGVLRASESAELMRIKSELQSSIEKQNTALSTIQQNIQTLESELREEREANVDAIASSRSEKEAKLAELKSTYASLSGTRQETEREVIALG